MIIPIKKIILENDYNSRHILLEVFPIIGAGFVPMIQTDYSRNLLQNVKTQKDLDAFKKDYSGFADYNTYDNTSQNLKRGVTYGAGIGAMLGGALYAIDDSNDKYSFRNDMEMLGGISAAPIATGAIGGLANGIIRNNILKLPTLKDEVLNKERMLQKTK